MMETKLNVQTEAAVTGSRVRRRQWFAVIVGLVAVGVVGLLMLSGFLFSPRPSAEWPAQPALQLREQLGVTVAPVNQAEIDALVREQAALREQLGVTVAPVNQAEIDVLVHEHAGREP